MNSSEEINQMQENDPCFLVIYDSEDEHYKCELWGYGEDVIKAKEQDEQAFEQIAAPTLRAAIDQGIAFLDRLIENSVKQGTKTTNTFHSSQHVMHRFV